LPFLIRAQRGLIFSKTGFMTELPIIQKTYDLIKWYLPHLNKLPRDHKFLLGDRMIKGLYNLLEELIRVRFTKNKREQLQAINTELDILRYQTRLLHDFQLLPGLLHELGVAVVQHDKFKVPPRNHHTYERHHSQLV
jgi:hypothetical protein